MPNFASLLKDEIARIARKEARRLADPLRKQVTAHRRDLAALKRENAELRRQLASLARASGRRASAAAGQSAEQQRPARFSAAGLRTLRSKLGMSAEEFGRLVGVSGQSVYNWEQEKARPRQQQIQRIAGLRGIGKRAAQAMLPAAE